MLRDFRTSINRILNERLTSPFWGTFLLSWLVWNWRIPYVSLFIDQDKLVKGTTRIDYIVNQCLNNGWLYTFWIPLLSTVIIVLIFPFLSTGAYWVFLKFNKWKTNMKNRVDGETLLTVEKSLQLREELRNLNKKYEAFNRESEDEIKLLNAEIVKLKEIERDKNKQLLESQEASKQLSSAKKNIGELEKKLTKIHADYDKARKNELLLIEKERELTEKLEYFEEREKKRRTQQSGNNIELSTHDEEVISLANRLIKQSSITEIDILLKNITSHKSINVEDKTAILFLRYNLIVITNTKTTYRNYKLSPTGKVFKNYFYSEIIKSPSSE